MHERATGPGQLTVCVFRNPDMVAAGKMEDIERRVHDPVIALQCHLPDNSQRNFEFFTSFDELRREGVVRASIRVFTHLPGRYLFDCRTACTLAGPKQRGDASSVMAQYQI